MNISWWLHPGIHETSRMQLTFNDTPPCHEETMPEDATDSASFVSARNVGHPALEVDALVGSTACRE
jgi:hypothetical protein